MCVWASSASGNCMYVGDLLQLLGMETEHMTFMVIQTEIDVRLLVPLGELPVQLGKKGEGEQIQGGNVSAFYHRNREQVRALLCLLTHQQS